jgi:hypothetical protein
MTFGFLVISARLPTVQTTHEEEVRESEQQRAEKVLQKGLGIRGGRSGNCARRAKGIR